MYINKMIDVLNLFLLLFILYIRVNFNRFYIEGEFVFIYIKYKLTFNIKPILIHNFPSHIYFLYFLDFLKIFSNQTYYNL